MSASGRMGGRGEEETGQEFGRGGNRAAGNMVLRGCGMQAGGGPWRSRDLLLRGSRTWPLLLQAETSVSHKGQSSQFVSVSTGRLPYSVTR